METINGLSQENSEKERIIKDLDENGYLEAKAKVRWV